jgi:hypothetical protein
MVCTDDTWRAFASVLTNAAAVLNNGDPPDYRARPDFSRPAAHANNAIATRLILYKQALDAHVAYTVTKAALTATHFASIGNDNETYYLEAAMHPVPVWMAGFSWPLGCALASLQSPATTLTMLALDRLLGYLSVRRIGLKVIQPIVQHDPPDHDERVVPFTAQREQRRGGLSPPRHPRGLFFHQRVHLHHLPAHSCRLLQRPGSRVGRHLRRRQDRHHGTPDPSRSWIPSASDAPPLRQRGCRRHCRQGRQGQAVQSLRHAPALAHQPRLSGAVPGPTSSRPVEHRRLFLRRTCLLLGIVFSRPSSPWMPRTRHYLSLS